MPKLVYEQKTMGPGSMALVDTANEILEDYAGQGFDLTLRQLYYQFVARGLIANKQAEYNRLGRVVNDARLAGLIDWDHIVDRTRSLRSLAHWGSPAEIISASANSYREELWADQPTRVEVWIEKDALVGVIERVCHDLDVPYFSCRGYTSQSEMWTAGQRLGRYLEAGQRIVVLHLGDHDPSGIDMTRDIYDRLWTFLANDRFRTVLDSVPRVVGGQQVEEIKGEVIGQVNDEFQVRRIALTWEQIEEYGPPPNPAKVTDSRAAKYIAEHGRESWELDALDPTTLEALIRHHVEGELDEVTWNLARGRQAERRQVLSEASRRWVEVAEFLNGDGS